MLIHLVMPPVYPALDGDTPGDAGQRIQDAANCLHLHVHAVHSVHGEGGPAVERGITHQVSSILIASVTWCLDIFSAMTQFHAAATEPRYPPPCSRELHEK